MRHRGLKTLKFGAYVYSTMLLAAFGAASGHTGIGACLEGLRAGVRKSPEYRQISNAFDRGFRAYADIGL